MCMCMRELVSVWGLEEDNLSLIRHPSSIKSFMFHQVSPNNTEKLVSDFPREVKYCNFIGQNAFLLQIKLSNSHDVRSLDKGDDSVHNRALISISDPYKEIYDPF